MKKVVFIIVAISILFTINGCSVKKVDELTDAEKFANEYSVSEENPFQYATLDDILDLFNNNKSGILFLGDSDSEWSTFGAKVLNKVVKKEKISKVYYLNPENIKHKKSDKYKQVKDLLNLSNKDSLPIVYVISNGSVIGQVDYFVHEDSSIDQNSIEELENDYLSLISEYV